MRILVILILFASYSFAQTPAESGQNSGESALQQEESALTPKVETAGEDTKAEAQDNTSPYSLLVAHRMQVMGYYDPEAGTTLSNSIKLYQESQNIPVNGLITTELLISLGLVAAAQNPTKIYKIPNNL